MDQQEDEHIREYTESSMTMKDFPISNAFFALSSKPIILFKTHPFHKFEPKINCWCVCDNDIQKYMVPPTFSEVWQYMLR